MQKHSPSKKKYLKNWTSPKVKMFCSDSMREKMKRKATIRGKKCIIHLSERKRCVNAEYIKNYIHTDFFLFCLILALVGCTFQGIFPIHLSCRIYWHQAVHDIPWSSLMISPCIWQLHNISKYPWTIYQINYILEPHEPNITCRVIKLVLITFKGLKSYFACSVTTIKPNWKQ